LVRGCCPEAVKSSQKKRNKASLMKTRYESGPSSSRALMASTVKAQGI